MQISNSEIHDGIDDNNEQTPSLDSAGASFQITLAPDAATWNFAPNLPTTPAGQLACIVFTNLIEKPWSYINGSLSGRVVTLSLRADAPAGQLTNVVFTIGFVRAATGWRKLLDPVIPNVGMPR